MKRRSSKPCFRESVGGRQRFRLLHHHLFSAKSNKTGTRKTVSKEKIVKEPGFLYFVGKGWEGRQNPDEERA